MKKIVIAIAVIVAIVWGGWLIAVPSDVMLRFAEDRMRQGNLQADIVGFRKGLFYSVSAEALDVKASDVRMLSVEDVRVNPDFLASLLELKGVVNFSGEIGNGTLTGTAQADKQHYKVALSLIGANLEKLGLFEQIGLTGSGVLDADMDMADNEGVATFAVNNAKFNTIRYRGQTIPVNMIDRIRGKLAFEGNTVTLESITLEGEGIFARATGIIRGNQMDVKLELMPERETMPHTIISALFGNYQASPGHYIIPVRQSLDF